MIVQHILLFTIFQLFFLPNLLALEMSSTHSLDNACRVCGNRLRALSFSSKKNKSCQYPCVEYKKSLHQVFGIDVESDCPLIHPSNFCSSCRLVLMKKEVADQKGIIYNHSVTVFQWKEYQEEGCTVREIII